MQHFGESLSGLVTIRAFRKQDLFMDKNRVGCARGQINKKGI